MSITLVIMTILSLLTQLIYSMDPTFWRHIRKNFKSQPMQLLIIATILVSRQEKTCGHQRRRRLSSTSNPIHSFEHARKIFYSYFFRKCQSFVEGQRKMYLMNEYENSINPHDIVVVHNLWISVDWRRMFRHSLSLGFIFDPINKNLTFKSGHWNIYQNLFKNFESQPIFIRYFTIQKQKQRIYLNSTHT